MGNWTRGGDFNNKIKFIGMFLNYHCEGRSPVTLPKSAQHIQTATPFQGSQ